MAPVGKRYLHNTEGDGLPCPGRRPLLFISIRVEE
jgi:hypothetical protein